MTFNPLYSFESTLKCGVTSPSVCVIFAKTGLIRFNNNSDTMGSSGLELAVAGTAQASGLAIRSAKFDRSARKSMSKFSPLYVANRVGFDFASRAASMAQA